MVLEHLSLQNFRSYSKATFTFSKATTLIVGPNTSGKTNLIEAVYLLATGKSFRAEKEQEMIQFEASLGRVKGGGEDTALEVVITNEKTLLKKYLVNGVSKKRADFVGILSSVLFSPQDLEIIIGPPSLRRNFFDDVLSQVDREYAVALSEYTKALRQRNALLERVRETGVRDKRQFDYWDSFLIKHGEVITQKREAFIVFTNSEAKVVFDFVAFYDKSVISEARLVQYQVQEVAAAATLVGPHRDDFSLSMFDNERGTTHDVKLFGSRGQQRLSVLQLKLLELLYIEQQVGERPLLLLDDIFSELDSEHIDHVLSIIGKQQTIITTTHEEFVEKRFAKDMRVLQLKET